MKIVALLLALWGMASGYEIPKNGQKVLPVSLPNQYGKSVTVGTDTRIILYVPDKKASNIVRELLDSKASDYVPAKKMAVVSDLSNAPSFVRTLFILPGLKAYEYDMLVIEDEFSLVIFKSELEKVSVIEVDNGIQKSVQMAASKEELEKIIEGLSSGKDR